MNTDSKDEVVYLYLDDIIPNRFQPREVFDERALKELAVSIKEHGVIQPIIVRNVKGKYEIIAGERRYKASALAGLTKIPAIIRDLDDKESSKVALLENLQRKNLTPIEEARTYQKILEIDEMTQEELAKTMGKSQSAVANKLRLLSLPDEIQDSLLKQQISERHARALLNIPDEEKQKEMMKKIIKEKMSVRAVEQEIKELYPKEDEESQSDMMSNNFIKITDEPMTASTSDFVNSSPLLPTADLPEDTSNYGKITIAPPEGEEMPENAPKFINYGEIDKDDNDEIESQLNLNSIVPSIDINEIKENAIDINKPTSSSPTADLDGLLNLQSNQQLFSNSGNNEERKFITPAEEIVKTDASKVDTEKTEDYFKKPDFVSLELPEEIQTTGTSNISLNSLIGNSEEQVSADNIYTIEEAIDKIRELVEDFKTHNIAVSTDEMDFEKSYQVIIKLDKTKDK